MIRVLVVDDSPTTSELLIHILGADPEITVVGRAADGNQAIKMAQELSPDVITMDVVMPDMDGVEATRRIMSTKPVPIVVVTAHADSDEPRVAFEALKAGALEVVAKPVDMGHDNQGIWGQSLVLTVKAVAGVKF